MGNKYYIKFGISNRKHAGSKAMRDVMHLLDEQGYHAMPALPVTVNKGVKLLIDIPLMILTVLFFVRTRGTVLYVIPSNALCSQSEIYSNHVFPKKSASKLDYNITI